MSNAEQLTEACTYHGEGPVWDAGAGVLRWVDMLAGDLLSMPPAGGPVTRHKVGQVAAALRPRRHGGLVVAVERGFALLDAADAEPRALLEVWTDPSVRMNEGGCDPQGRFYCGSMAYDLAPGRGSLYRLDADLSVHTVLTGVTISNGLVWSLDGETVYYVDTPTSRIDAFDFDAMTGTFSGRRTVVAIPADAGVPDGMTIDADGGLWVALWGGAAVHRYTVTGKLAEVVTLPVTQVTACTFGGPALDQLYITTSRQDLPEHEQPQAGALFIFPPGLTGLPTASFAG